MTSQQTQATQKTITGIKNTICLTFISRDASGDEKRGSMVELMRTRGRLKLIGVKEKNREREGGEVDTFAQVSSNLSFLRGTLKVFKKFAGPRATLSV